MNIFLIMECINCRSLISPLDMAKFDELISPHEMRALQKKAEDGDSSDTISIEYDFEFNDDSEEGKENHVNGSSTEEVMEDQTRGKLD